MTDIDIKTMDTLLQGMVEDDKFSGAVFVHKKEMQKHLLLGTR